MMWTRTLTYSNDGRKTSSRMMVNSAGNSHSGKGLILENEPDEPMWLRCVSPENDDDRTYGSSFHGSDNDVVIDSISQLMWQDEPINKELKHNWSEAYSHCESLQLSGHNDWRLPTINEVFSLVEELHNTRGLNNGIPANTWSEANDQERIGSWPSTSWFGAYGEGT